MYVLFNVAFKTLTLKSQIKTPVRKQISGKNLLSQDALTGLFQSFQPGILRRLSLLHYRLRLHAQDILVFAFILKKSILIYMQPFSHN